MNCELVVDGSAWKGGEDREGGGRGRERINQS